MTAPLYLSATLRRIEAACAGQPLMQRAGAAAVELAARLVLPGRPVLVLAGPGNNGGDAFEAAGRLQQAGLSVHLAFAGDPDRLPADAAAARARFLAAGGEERRDIPSENAWGLIVDGLFGIGLARVPDGRYAEWIAAANRLSRTHACPLLALDCPSGLDADTGRVLGACVEASHTVTFIADKPGLHTADGPDRCGEVIVAPLNLDVPALPEPDGHLIAPPMFARYLVPRRRNSHKGSYGNAGVLGGSPTMAGAALLAARAALLLGAGRVYVGLLDEEAPAVDLVQPELMLRRPAGMLAAGLDALACGPGLGTGEGARMLLEQTLAFDIPLVLDADALNLLAADAVLAETLTRRSAPALLTPHPAEAARLLAGDTAAVQADRIAAASAVAGRFNVHVALKGCGTVVAAPDGRWWINTSGNPGMATAGMGDVLTGLALALLAQGWPAEEALLAAVHLHGLAGDAAVAAGQGPIGLCASDVIPHARRIFNGWLNPGICR